MFVFVFVRAIVAVEPLFVFVCEHKKPVCVCERAIISVEPVFVFVFVFVFVCELCVSLCESTLLFQLSPLLTKPLCCQINLSAAS